MGEPKGYLVVPVGFNPDDDIRALELDASDNLKVVIGDTALTDLLTELQQKLETADLELTAAGALKVVFKSQDIDVEVKQQNPADLRAGIEGWISSAWQKNPLAFGISGIVEANLSNTNLDAGANNLDGTAVPAGEIQVITAIACRYTGTVPSLLTMQALNLAGGIVLFALDSPETLMWYPATVNVLLQEGDTMRCRITSATSGDSLLFRYSGYRIDIDQ